MHTQGTQTLIGYIGMYNITWEGKILINFLKCEVYFYIVNK